MECHRILTLESRKAPGENYASAREAWQMKKKNSSGKNFTVVEDNKDTAARINMIGISSGFYYHVGNHGTVVGGFACSDPAVPCLQLSVAHDVIDPHPGEAEPGKSVLQQKVSVGVTIASPPFSESVAQSGSTQS